MNTCPIGTRGNKRLLEFYVALGVYVIRCVCVAVGCCDVTNVVVALRNNIGKTIIQTRQRTRHCLPLLRTRLIAIILVG